MESVSHYTSSFIALNETVKMHRPCLESGRHNEENLHTQRMELSLQPTGEDA